MVSLFFCGKTLTPIKVRNSRISQLWIMKHCNVTVFLEHNSRSVQDNFMRLCSLSTYWDGMPLSNIFPVSMATNEQNYEIVCFPSITPEPSSITARKSVHMST